MKTVILIPARFASSRYPGKPLVELKGSGGVAKPLIQRSVEAARRVSGVSEVYVTTDDDRIADACAAFGVGDYTWGELPAAEVTLKAGSHVSAQELIDFCASHIARFKRPRLIRIVDSLPMTAAGKLARKALKARNADLKVENEG